MILFKRCRFVITNPSFDGILENGWVLVDGPEIRAVGTGDEPADSLGDAHDLDIVDCTTKLVMPGLIDSHNHLGDHPYNLLPGIDPSTSQYSGISECLQKLIWPAYVWATAKSTFDLTLVSMMNAIKYGTTTITSAFPFPDAGYSAGALAKIRLVLHPQVVSNVELGDGFDDNDYLANTEEVIRNFHNAEEGRIQVAAHPHALYSCTERLLVGCMELAEQYDVGFATHLLESRWEREAADVHYASRGGVVTYLQELGMLQQRSLFFHCSQMTRAEFDILAEARCAIAHCPQSNASFFGDVADVPAMLDAGVTVGLGTDMPAANVFDNMYTAFIVHSIVPPGQQRALDPWVPLELATIGSARALRLDERIGTLEPGKRADIITVDLSRNASLYPLNGGNLLYWIASQGAGTLVDDSMVDGMFLRRNGEFTFLDEEAIVARSNEWLMRFASWYRDRKEVGEPVTVVRWDDFSHP